MSATDSGRAKASGATSNSTSSSTADHKFSSSEVCELVTTITCAVSATATAVGLRWTASRGVALQPSHLETRSVSSTGINKSSSRHDKNTANSNRHINRNSTTGDSAGSMWFSNAGAGVRPAGLHSLTVDGLAQYMREGHVKKVRFLAVTRSLFLARARHPKPPCADSTGGTGLSVT